MEKTVTVHNLGVGGVVADLPSHTLPPEIWSNSINMLFDRKGARTAGGQKIVFGTPTVAPGFIYHVPSPSSSFWIYASLTKAYVYDGGVHTNITRQTNSVDVNYTATAFDKWHGTLLGGIPIFNNGSDVPQFWASLTTSQKLQNLTNWPSTLRAKALRAFGRYVMALNITISGVNSPHVVRWSHEADPGTLPSSWDITNPAIDAGQLELTDVEGGVIIDGAMLGDTFVVYKQTSTHVLNRVATANIFQPRLLFAGSGVLAMNCIGLIKKGTQHFVVTEDDIIIHSGTKEARSVADDRVRDRIFGEMDQTQRDKTHVLVDERTNLVGVAYSAEDATSPNRLAVYDFVKDTWTFRSYLGTSAATGSVVASTFPAWSSLTDTWDEIDYPWSQDLGRGLVIADPNNSQLYQIEVGNTWAPAGDLPFLERTGLAIIGRDRQGQPKVDYAQRKLVHRVWPKISGAGQVNVRVGAAETLTSEIVWQDPVLFDPTTGLYVDLNVPANGRLIAVRFEAIDHTPWRLESYDLDMSFLGNL